MATGRGACAAIQPNTGWRVSAGQRARVFHERENSGLLFAASALSCNFSSVARRQVLLSSNGSLVVIRCRLFHLLCADSYKLVEGEYVATRATLSRIYSIISSASIN